MKKLIITFSLLPTLVFGAVESDLRKGVDLTSTNYVTQSLLNQLTDNGTIRDTGSITNNKGGVMRSTIRPDVTLNPRYTNWLWLDISAGIPGTLKQYVPTGDAFTNWVQASIGAGSVTTFNIADYSITASKMATNSVANYAIQDSAVDGNKLAAFAVTPGKVAPSAISNANIAPSTIDGGRIALNTISNANLYDYTIQSNKIAVGGIVDFNIKPGGLLGSNAIAARSINGSNILAGAITNEHLADATVTSNKISLGNGVNFANIDTNLSFGVPVMWGFVLSNGTLARGLGCSAAYSGSGLYTITFNVARSTTNYSVGGICHEDTSNGRHLSVVTKALGSVTLRVRNTTAAAAAVEDFSFQIFDFN